MGCASSMSGSSSMSSVAKHPADLYVASLRLQRLKIDKFDDYFAKVEEPANKLVTFVNTLALDILDIKLAAATVLGGFQVKLAPGTDSDIVLLEFAKADGTLPAADEATILLKKADVKAADDKLAAVLSILHASSPSGLAAGPDGLVDRADFNEALKAFKAAVGAGYTVKLAIKPAAAAGGSTVIATLSKPEFKGTEEEPSHKPVSLLTVAASCAAKDIYSARVGIAEQVHALAKASKDLSLAFEVKQGKVLVPAVDDDSKSAGVAKAVATYNIQAYKLVHAGLGAAGEVNLAKAVVGIVKSLRTRVEDMAKEAGKDAKAAIPRVMPKLEVKEDCTFDFSLDVSFPDPDLSLPEFPNCLPGPAKFAWKAIMKLKDDMTDLIGQFGAIKDEVQALADGGAAVFENMGDTISGANLDFSVAVKIPGHITDNLAQITGLAALATAFVGLIKGVVDDLTASLAEVEKLAASV